MLPPLKKYRGSSVAFYPEDSIEESMEVGRETHIDSDILANIEAYITDETTTAEAAIAVEVDTEVEADVEVKRVDDAEDDAESSARGTVEIRVDVVAGPEVHADITVPTSDKGSREYFQIRDVTEEAQRTRLLDRIGVLERDNMRLYGMLSVERDRVDSIQRLMG
ncbi:hypothetical protein Tco_0137420, partial [Tanacetum coccineum]